MRILVTGGCGFIGGHLCELLVQKGHVVVLDDLSTGSLENVASLKRSKRFSFVKGTICNARLVDRKVYSLQKKLPNEEVYGLGD